MDNDICYYCGLYEVKVEGLCRDCLIEHQETWAKMDEYLMGNT